MSQIWGKVNKQTSETNIKKTSDRGIQIGKTQIQGNTDWNWKNAKVSKSKGVKMAGDTNNFLSTVLKKNKDRRRLMWNKFFFLSFYILSLLTFRRSFEAAVNCNWLFTVIWRQLRNGQIIFRSDQDSIHPAQSPYLR